MKIYTKTGDKGTTSDVLGQRVSKGDIKIDLQGSVDEINANIGYLRALIQNTPLQSSSMDIDAVLRDIQYSLFKIGSDISSNFAYLFVQETDITMLEQGIDTMTSEVGALEHFIYYSGTAASSYCQVARSVTRRAERIFVRFLENQEYNLDYQFVNRLSDFLFTLARYLNHLAGSQEELMVLR